MNNVIYLDAAQRQRRSKLLEEAELHRLVRALLSSEPSPRDAA